MCGIAGVIHRNGTSNIGREMTDMLQALKHRGPDSTGFAIYGEPDENTFIMRFKVAEKEELSASLKVHDEIAKRKAQVDETLKTLGVHVIELEEVTEYAFRYRIEFAGDMKLLADHVEDVEGAEILSIGSALELIKDLGDAADVSGAYNLGDFTGTHGIGHTRMATESDVDIRSAHPYWAYPYSDIAVVHNGQITNYWLMRRQLEREGQRFVSNCDSELLAVYTASNMEKGMSLEESLRMSIDDIDGVFTYLITTKDQLGMAKDSMAAKPMVLYESDDLVVLASEEVAIRAIIPQEIDTWDPYESEVRVWQA